VDPAEPRPVGDLLDASEPRGTGRPPAMLAGREARARNPDGSRASAGARPCVSANIVRASAVRIRARSGAGTRAPAGKPRAVLNSR